MEFGFTEVQEKGYVGVRWPDMLGLHLVGPSLILIGPEEQKKKPITPITRGETVCVEVFTEPNAGSDEANQQTRAVEQRLGIKRKLKDINGYDAVWLWWQYRNEYDENALLTLLEYNKEDVINLKALKERLL